MVQARLEGSIGSESGSDTPVSIGLSVECPESAADVQQVVEAELSLRIGDWSLKLGSSDSPAFIGQLDLCSFIVQLQSLLSGHGEGQSVAFLPLAGCGWLYVRCQTGQPIALELGGDFNLVPAAEGLPAYSGGVYEAYGLLVRVRSVHVSPEQLTLFARALEPARQACGPPAGGLGRTEHRHD